MTNLNSVNSEQWRANYDISVDSYPATIHKKIKVKFSMFNELVTDKSKKILDLGCGSGFFLTYFASRGFRNLYGIEPDAALIEHIPADTAVEIRNCRAENIAFEDCTFDVVFVHGVLHHLKGLDSYEASCNEIHRVLKPGGLVFIMEPGIYWILGAIKTVSKYLGVVFSPFRGMSGIVDEKKAELRFFGKNHRFIKDFIETQKGFKIIVDKYFLYTWVFTAQKGR